MKMMNKSRTINYRGYIIRKADGSGFLISKDDKPVTNKLSMAAAYLWIDREVSSAKETET